MCTETDICKPAGLGAPISVSYENSDEFWSAELIASSDRCMCFKSRRPVETGRMLFIMSQLRPLSDHAIDAWEGCFARASTCETVDIDDAGYYRVRVDIENVLEPA